MKNKIIIGFLIVSLFVNGWFFWTTQKTREISSESQEVQKEENRILSGLPLKAIDIDPIERNMTNEKNLLVLENLSLQTEGEDPLSAQAQTTRMVSEGLYPSFEERRNLMNVGLIAEYKLQKKGSGKEPLMAVFFQRKENLREWYKEVQQPLCEVEFICTAVETRTVNGREWLILDNGYATEVTEDDTVILLHKSSLVFPMNDEERTNQILASFSSE